VFIDHREVEFAVGQPRQQPLHVIIHDRQRQRGLLAAQTGQGRGHERGPRGGEAAEPEPAARRPAISASSCSVLSTRALTVVP
jgi:hypothetical protein